MDHSLNLLQRVLCRLGRHYWVVSRLGIRRYCLGCQRREVLAVGGWAPHTYPPDADQFLDPTPCVDEYGDASTVGFETYYRDLVRRSTAALKSRARENAP